MLLCFKGACYKALFNDAFKKKIYNPSFAGNI